MDKDNFIALNVKVGKSPPISSQRFSVNPRQRIRCCNLTLLNVKETKSSRATKRVACSN